MTVKLEDIPSLHGPEPHGPPRRRYEPLHSRRQERRSFLKAATAAGAGIGLAALGVFPPVRQARADGYSILGTCPSYAASHNCTPGCGPSAICGSWNCCNPSTHPTYPGYHKNDGVTYRLRPNQCAGGIWDGWSWYYDGLCGACRAVKFRCHDGYKKINGSWVKTICKWTLYCKFR